MNDYIWIFLGGIVIAVLSILFRRREKRLFENAISAVATVVRYDDYENVASGDGRVHRMYSAVMTYPLADGTMMEAKEQCGSNHRKYEIGQSVDIEYSPEKPDFFVPRGDNSRSVAFAVMLLFGLAMIALAVFIYLQQGGAM